MNYDNCVVFFNIADPVAIYECETFLGMSINQKYPMEAFTQKKCKQRASL